MKKVTRLGFLLFVFGSNLYEEYCEKCEANEEYERVYLRGFPHEFYD